MTSNEYQQFCKTNHKRGNSLTVMLLGLGEESGEVQQIFKKALRDEKDVDVEHVCEELGDVIWYIANIASYVGLSLEEVINYNVKKLKERY